MLLILFTCYFGIHSASCQNNINMLTSEDSVIESFMLKNSRNMSFEWLQGEYLYLTADENSIVCILEVSDPQLLLRLFMKGFSIYIDPTGRKKETFEVQIPAAESIDMESLGIERTEPPVNNSSEEKPNILPFIEPMNKKGMIYSINGKEIKNISQAFSVRLDVDRDKLYYYVLLPVNGFLETKNLSANWTIGIYIQEIEMMQDQQPGMMELPMTDKFNNGNNRFSQEISQWIPFSFDKLISINLE